MSAQWPSRYPVWTLGGMGGHDTYSPPDNAIVLGMARLARVVIPGLACRLDSYRLRNLEQFLNGNIECGGKANRFMFGQGKGKEGVDLWRW